MADTQKKTLKQLFKGNTFSLLSAIIVISSLSTYLLLSTAIEKEKKTLLSNVKIISNLIGSVAQFDSVHSVESVFGNDSNTATLQQINNAFNGFTKDENEYEYIVGEVAHGEISFIAFSGHRPVNVKISQIQISVPMRKALKQEQGVLTAADYDGTTTLAAYAPIPNTQWGLVVKKDLNAFLNPFYATAGFAFLLTILLSYFIYKITVARERKLSNEIEDKEARFRQLIESSHDWVWEVNLQGEYTYSSPQVYGLIGYQPEEVIGKTPFELMPEEERTKLSRIFREIAKHGKDIKNLEYLSNHKAGHKVYMLTSGTPFFNEHGELDGYRGIDKDITSMKEHQLKVENMAYFDGLTQLANRQNVTNRITEEISYCRRNGFISSLLYLDLDGFKYINDALGHDHGDQVLIEVANRLKHLTRDSDVVGRLGGDEFVVLLRNTSSDHISYFKDLENLLQRVIQDINLPIEGFHTSLHVGASIGVAFVPEDGDNVHELLRHADSAMYEAKKAGKNQYVFYHDKLQAEANERMEFKAKLTEAFKNNEFELFYQKQYDLTGTELYGVEALIRWRFGETYISPGSFLPYIEEFHLSEQLDRWVINRACEDLNGKLSHLPEFAKVSVNFTSSSFDNYSFIEYLLETCQNHDIPTSRFTLEITEDTIIENIDSTTKALARLKEEAFSIAIDDFGTGYSSLSYLSQLQFDIIKIDKSFINQIQPDTTDHYICKLIIKLAQDLNKKIVAEGVETQDQIEFLSNFEVDIVQGFIYSKPQPAEQVEV